MQLKTSFFNKRFFWKSVSRFWPVWGTYFAIWVIMFPVVIVSNFRYYESSNIALQDFVLEMSLVGGLVMNLIFGALSAMAVWSFQYSARSAHGTACLPLRRESVFFSAAASGLLPMLAANVAVYLLALLAELYVGFADPSRLAFGLLINSLMTVFFFGFATLCAQLTGNVLVLPAVYAVLNFVCVGLELLVRVLLLAFVFGMNGTADNMMLRPLSPVVCIAMDCQVVNYGRWNVEPATLENVWILAVYAAVGVLMLVGALLLYRRRRMETAGDVVAVNALKPVFRWCMALGCAVCFGCLMYAILWSGSYHGMEQAFLLVCMLLLMIVGAFIGWFAAEMMMKKSFRVFRSGWGQFAVCCVLIVALMCAAEFDLFGYERYVPAPEKVVSVKIDTSGDEVVLREPENILAACEVHREVTENKAINERDAWEIYGTQGDVYGEYVYFTYELSSGRTVERRYTLPYRNNAPETYGSLAPLQELINCGEAIAYRKQLALPVTAATVEYGSVNWRMSAQEWADALGYESAQAFACCNVLGMTRQEFDALSDDLLREKLWEAVNNYADFGTDGGYYDEYGNYYADDYYYEAYHYGGFSYTSAAHPMLAKEFPAGGVPIDKIDTLDWSRVNFWYDVVFSAEEIVELYNECIVPDMEDGTIGRYWLISDRDYYETVYAAGISFDLCEGVPGAKNDHDVRSDHFYTVPTVDSVRTNAWLADHGVTLYTIAEK